MTTHCYYYTRLEPRRGPRRCAWKERDGHHRYTYIYIYIYIHTYIHVLYTIAEAITGTKTSELAKNEAVPAEAPLGGLLFMLLSLLIL